MIHIRCLMFLQIPTDLRTLVSNIKASAGELEQPVCSSSSPISDSRIPVPQHTEVNHANCQPSGLDLNSNVKRSLVYVEKTPPQKDVQDVMKQKKLQNASIQSKKVRLLLNYGMLQELCNNERKGIKTILPGPTYMFSNIPNFCVFLLFI